MYREFLKSFLPDGPVDLDRLAACGPEIVEFLDHFGGRSFRRGLYRVMRPAEGDIWKARILYAYPEFHARISCFGFDWMGNAFATDSNRLVEEQPGVVMFEPGTGKALDIPSNLESFHEVALNKHGEAVLAISFNETWTEAGGAQPDYSHCIGYKKPLFLGGKDTVDNLEMSDIDVYWHLLGQLIRKTRGLA
jgi:hypothetical protein